MKTGRPCWWPPRFGIVVSARRTGVDYSAAKTSVAWLRERTLSDGLYL